MRRVKRDEPVIRKQDLQTRYTVLPLLRAQWLRIFIQPADVAVILFPPRIRSERGNALAKLNQSSREVRQSAIRLFPVEPG
ncbi:hypothetical protein D3C78_1687370 [compost metagenome]